MTNDASRYHYSGEQLGHHHAYLLPSVLRILSLQTGKRIFELGCGNGSVANLLSQRGFEIVGVDPSEEGIATARAHYPHLNVTVGSAYDDLASQYGTFPVVLSLEVIEHVFQPRDFARTLYSLVEPGGIAIVSTPYHGYFKNLALALTGKMDDHFTALWDYGHIKFWSEKTLGALLREAGFSDLTFQRVGRIAPLAKSMIVVARRG